MIARNLADEAYVRSLDRRDLASSITRGPRGGSQELEDEYAHLSEDERRYLWRDEKRERAETARLYDGLVRPVDDEAPTPGFAGLVVPLLLLMVAAVIGYLLFALWQAGAI